MNHAHLQVWNYLEPAGAAVDIAGVGRTEIMRAAVHVEARPQAVYGENLPARPKGRGRALLLGQKGRIDRPVASSTATDQVDQRLALEPFAPRTVALQPAWKRPRPGFLRCARGA